MIVAALWFALLGLPPAPAPRPALSFALIGSAVKLQGLAPHTELMLVANTRGRWSAHIAEQWTPSTGERRWRVAVSWRIAAR